MKTGNIREIPEKKLYIFDMDGTIYLGDQVFSYAIDFIKHLRRLGKKVLFFTNNASHSTAFYLEKLQRLGFEPSPEEIMTSGDVTADFLLRHRAGKTVYLVGTPDLVDDFRKKNIPLVDDGADIVLSSFDTTLTYGKLDTACRLVRGGAEFLSTHPDFNCPTETGFIPDSGAIAAFITASTGRVPTYFGKPYPETLQMICEKFDLPKKDMCVFGDRLYTDIALGKRGGVTSILVLTGETKLSDVKKAHRGERPDFIFPSLLEVHQLFTEA